MPAQVRCYGTPGTGGVGGIWQQQLRTQEKSFAKAELQTEDATVTTYIASCIQSTMTPTQVRHAICKKKH